MVFGSSLILYLHFLISSYTFVSPSSSYPLVRGASHHRHKTEEPYTLHRTSNSHHALQRLQPTQPNIPHSPWPTMSQLCHYLLVHPPPSLPSTKLTLLHRLIGTIGFYKYQQFWSKATRRQFHLDSLDKLQYGSAPDAGRPSIPFKDTSARISDDEPWFLYNWGDGIED